MNILIVEDNLEHLKITKYLLSKNNLDANIFIIRDGQEMLDYLFRSNKYSDESIYPLPDIILLDLNIPKRDGREVLEIINADSMLKNIPIVVVSTSNREEDINFALQHGAIAYISKSSGFEKLKEELGSVIVRTIKGR